MIQQKIEKREELYLYIPIDVFEGNLEDVCKKVLNLKERLKQEHQVVKDNPNKYFKYELFFTSYYDEGMEAKIRGVRLETDEEFNNRIERNKKQQQAGKMAAKKRKENQEKRELTLLETLKKKYEDAR